MLHWESVTNGPLEICYKRSNRSKKPAPYLYMMRMNISNPSELFKTRLLKNSQFFKILKSTIDVKRKAEHVYKVSVIHKHNFNV